MDCFEKLEIVREFIKEISTQRDIGLLLHHLTSLITRLTRSDRSSLFLYDKNRDEIWTMIAEGVPHEIRVPVDKSIAGGAIRERCLQVIQDVSDDVRFNAEIDKQTGYETKNILAYPLFDSNNDLLGVIEVINKLEGEFEEDDINALKLFSSFIGYVLESKILNEEMEQIIEERTETIRQLNCDLEEEVKNVTRLSETDSLTQAYNRLKTDRVLSDEVSAAESGAHPLAMILFDIDDFKAINDRFGHLNGDTVLVAIAGAVMDNLPNGGHFGRWGGEEFIVILPGHSLDAASEAAQMLRQQINALTVEGVGKVSCSFGVAVFEKGMSADDLIRLADEAMYRAKKKGKNRIEVI